MLLEFALSLLLTLAVELPVCLLWGLRGRDMALAALVNVLTNPPAVLLHVWFPAAAATALIETAVTGAEGWLYRRCSRARRPWLLSIAANGASFLAGLLFNWLC